MFENKTVIITGAAKGIGRAIALKFASEKANIVINYRSEQPKDLLTEIESLGSKAALFQADVSRFEEAKNLIDFACKTFSSIDVVVNNAGITKDNLIMRMSEDDFDKVLETNLKGAFNIIKHVSGIMLKQRSGNIINISSVVGLSGNAGQANYAASKAGLIGLTKSVARELASRNITVNAVAPGFIETDMTKVLSDTIKENMISMIPLKKFGQCEDIANAVVFLASQPYITGQVLQVDGGMLI